MYRDTYHLSVNELAELKSSLWWGCCEMGNLSAEEKQLVEAAEWSKDIPDSVVHHAFCGYVFTEDDFWL